MDHCGDLRFDVRGLPFRRNHECSHAFRFVLVALFVLVTGRFFARVRAIARSNARACA
jgi:hypothetical protein